MFDWLKKKRQPPPDVPDFSAVDSLEKALGLARDGQLRKLLLLPATFGGEDVPPNFVYVPEWVVERKAEIDESVVRPLAEAGKISRYQAAPQYEGASFVPNAITIEASDPASFSVTIAIWGEALRE